jgi:DNA topoisomerase-1
MRKVGVDEKSGLPIFVRIGRYGPMVQIGEATDDEKPTFYSLPKGTNVDTVGIEEVKKAMELPRTVGQTKDGEEIVANVGRFGPYVKVGKSYVSIKDEDPRSITLETALKLIAEKAKKDKEKFIQIFEGSTIQVINGPYGPYVTDGKKNAKIPKDADPKKLTLKECEKLIAEAPAKKSFKRKAKK